MLCLSVQGEKIQGFKRLNPLGFQDDKIPPKSPRPRRNIWLSRSQSDIFSCKPIRKVNVQDPYYNPPTIQRAPKARKINPFTAREDLCGGKIKFFDVPSKSVFSLVFDLHSPPGSLFSNQPPAHGPVGPPQEASYYWQQLPGRQCHSLPVSPQLPRSEVFHLAAAVSSNNNGSLTCNSSQLSTTLPGESSDQDVLCLGHECGCHHWEADAGYISAKSTTVHNFELCFYYLLEEVKQVMLRCPVSQSIHYSSLRCFVVSPEQEKTVVVFYCL